MNLNPKLLSVAIHYAIHGTGFPILNWDGKTPYKSGL